ncbi:MAG TPA: DUF6798 domain-containing protein [Bacillota bacterium]|nr:DUF6798 domain-containing protein [Bacillota bacterium]
MNKQGWVRENGRYILLAVIFGVITTILNYSGYGVSDHIEQLPIIIRSIDSSYLVNDFFTNVNVQSIARSFYAHFIAILAGSEHNLPFVFLILTLFSNISISVITFLLTYRLFNNSKLAGIYASALVMSVITFGLGWLSVIYQKSMIPSTIAIPFIMGAIWSVVCGNLVVGMILSGIATFFHPLFGLEIGGVLFITFGAAHLISKRKITKEGWKTIIPSLLILITLVLIFFIPEVKQSSIDSNLFIYILAYFRHPHHYIPSAFKVSDYIYAIAFLCAIFLIYYRGRREREGWSNLIIAILGITVILLCIGGYIFVEIIPSRIWVTAQTFRLLYIVKWIGLIIIAGMIADKNLGKSMKRLYLVSVLNPLFLGGVALSETLSERIGQNCNRFLKVLVPSLILLIPFALLGYLSTPLPSVLLLALYALLIFLFGKLPQKILYPVLLMGLVLTIAVGIFSSRLPYLKQSSFINSKANHLALKFTSELGPEGDEVVEFARRNTKEGSIFLTPPDWGQFRLRARRAIVADLKAFPFADKAMLEWYDRIVNCYGKPKLKGYARALNELNENYRGINDKILLNLQGKYNFSYAVLYRQTVSNFKVIFQNGKYKVVYLDGEK